jgi:hypothetical protein
LLREAVGYRAALQVRTRQAAPADWAMTRNNLGLVLRDQAGLAENTARIALPGKAVKAYRAALGIHTQHGAPGSWAMTQNYLGNVLRDQAQLVAGTERVRLLGQAMQSYQAALQVYTRQAVPDAWAMTQRIQFEAFSTGGPDAPVSARQSAQRPNSSSEWPSSAKLVLMAMAAKTSPGRHVSTSITRWQRVQVTWW